MNNNRNKDKKLKEKIKLSTQPYKGVRDFYPEDWRFQTWLFWQMASAAELFGYENYTASPLEYSDLYIAKSGQEIVENETYNLIDRGGRKVTLRPEMTPTIARMIAARSKELPKPIRWYSIPNLFRYEKPQRGRLREHYQFNADIFGVEGVEAEIELIEMGAKILEKMGLKKEDFEIRINNRKIWKGIFDKFNLKENERYQVSKLIDKKNKISKEKFQLSISEILKDKSEDFLKILEKDKLENIKEYIEKEDFEKTEKLLSALKEKGLENAIFDLTLMRGFDYYTDIVFEFFDTNPKNNRAMFGGGRYDDLMEIFGKEKIPAVGLGMGDVTARDALEARNILPELKSKTKVIILPIDIKFNSESEDLAKELRNKNINTEIDFSQRKISKKINSADKKGIEWFIIIGENESMNKKYTIKNIFNNNKKENLFKEEIAKFLK